MCFVCHAADEAKQVGNAGTGSNKQVTLKSCDDTVMALTSGGGWSPAFNVAESYICIAAVRLFCGGLREEPAPSRIGKPRRVTCAEGNMANGPRQWKDIR